MDSETDSMPKDERTPLLEEQKCRMKEVVNVIQASPEFLQNEVGVHDKPIPVVTILEETSNDKNAGPDSVSILEKTPEPLHDLDIRHARVVLSASDDPKSWTTLPKKFWQRPVRFKSEEHEHIHSAYCITGYTLEMHEDMVRNHGAVWVYANIVFGSSFPPNLRGERSILQPIRLKSQGDIYS
jgi:hypothetical protein